MEKRFFIEPLKPNTLYLFSWNPHCNNYSQSVFMVAKPQQAAGSLQMNAYSMLATKRI